MERGIDDVDEATCVKVTTRDLLKRIMQHKGSIYAEIEGPLSTFDVKVVKRDILYMLDEQGTVESQLDFKTYGEDASTVNPIAGWLVRNRNYGKCRCSKCS